MVGTLIKHEVRRTLRWYGAILAAGALIVGSGVLMMMLLPSPMKEIFNAVAAFGALLVPTAVPIWLGIDFYRSSYSKTGYLTRALPAEGATIFWVKLLYAYALSLLAVAAGMALGYVTAIGSVAAAGGPVAEVNETLGAALRTLAEALPGWALALFVVVALLWPLVWLAAYYFAATVGSEGWASKLGVGGPVLVWFLFYLAMQAAGLLGMLIPLQLVMGDGPLRVETVMLDFAALGSEEMLPLGVFLTIFLVGAVGIAWASVSFVKKVELR